MEQLLLLEVAMTGFDPHARGVIGYWVQAGRRQSRCYEPARRDHYRQWVKFGPPAPRIIMASPGTFVPAPAQRRPSIRQMLMTGCHLRNLVSGQDWWRGDLLWPVFVIGCLFSVVIRALVV
jgi:hypothetical protein